MQKSTYTPKLFTDRIMKGLKVKFKHAGPCMFLCSDHAGNWMAIVKFNQFEDLSDEEIVKEREEFETNLKKYY